MKIYCRYYKQRKQVSYDGGVTWNNMDEYRRGDLYEYDSIICTYDPTESFSGQYFTFEAITDCTFGIIPKDYGDSNPYNYHICYSLDSGSTWNRLDTSTSSTTVTVTAGNKIYWKDFFSNVAGITWDQGSSSFVATGQFNAEGNIMSLCWGDDFLEDCPSPICRMVKTLERRFPTNPGYYDAHYYFEDLLKDCTGLTNACDVIMPATDGLKQYLYSGMFEGCTSLKTPPVLLPAANVPACGYMNMFKNCHSLIETPDILATKVGNSGFTSMFENCTNTTKVMENLYAETIYFDGDHAYDSMFKNCVNIKKSPNLLMERFSGNDTFYNCLSLEEINSCSLCFITNDKWLYNVKSSGTFEKVYSAFFIVDGDRTIKTGIPSTWNIVDKEPCDDYMYVGYTIGRLKVEKCYEGKTVLNGGDVIIPQGGGDYADPDMAYVGNCINRIDNGTFNNNTTLEKVYISNSVTSIGDSAFANCNSLQSIVIPSGVTSIGDKAFYGGTALTSVIIEAVTPPTLGQNVFVSVARLDDLTIYVPAQSLNTYKTAPGWSEYANLIQAIQ